MRPHKPTQTELGRILSARGETFADLAKKSGVNIRTVYNLACGANKTRKARAVVERTLGMVIWPKPDTANAAPTEASR